MDNISKDNENLMFKRLRTTAIILGFVILVLVLAIVFGLYFKNH